MAVDLWSSVSSQALILSDSPALVICSNGGRRTNTFPPPPSAGFSGRLTYQRFKSCDHSLFSTKFLTGLRSRYTYSRIPRSTDSSSSEGSSGNTGAPSNPTKVPFGYSRKDVILIGLGVTVSGVALKSGLEFVGVDSFKAGNAVQLVMVLGLTIGWIATYIFRVSNKDMTYAQQLKDYENKVMEKRLEGLTEAELEALLEQVEEEKRRLAGGEQVK